MGVCRQLVYTAEISSPTISSVHHRQRPVSTHRRPRESTTTQVFCLSQLYPSVFLVCFFCFYQLVSIAIGILVQCIMYVCMYVCMYVIFIRCDKRTSNNKHKKQSQNVDVQYKAAKPKKTISLDKAI